MNNTNNKISTTSIFNTRIYLTKHNMNDIVQLEEKILYFKSIILC